MTTETYSITFLSVVSRYSFRIALDIAEFNKLDIMPYGIQNAYLTVLCREKIRKFAGSQFGEE